MKKPVHRLNTDKLLFNSAVTQPLLNGIAAHSANTAEASPVKETLSIVSETLPGKTPLNIVPFTVREIPYWQLSVKRTLDILFSATGIVILSPLLAIIAICTRLSSAGKIIYSQQRIGFNNKPFIIYKFRSMCIDAEKNGPALSSENDVRITSWGKFMRKWRLDELPQLWNILKGEMSFVGPRPERAFYIDEINKHAYGFSQLLKVKPGLTSWGMVQFGYASNVSEMVDRLRFDLEYIQNPSLLIDFKIMLYTFRTILTGKGK